jgi:hypothetical protein
LKKLLISHYRSSLSHSAGERILKLCSGFDTENGFLEGYCSLLSGKVEELFSASTRRRRLTEVAEVNEADREFDSAFTNLRGYLRTMKKIGKLMEEQSEASAQIYKRMEHFGTTIEDESLYEQMRLTSIFLDELASGDLPAKAQAEPLVDAVMRAHNKLVDAQQRKFEAKVARYGKAGEYEAAITVNRLVLKIYNHIADYAELGDERYGTVLRKIENNLTPIAAQVKAAKTRGENKGKE